MIQPYVVETIRAGILTTAKINVVKMPRDRFVEIVTEALDEDDYGNFRADMLAVAGSIQRFPLAKWIDPIRGCGCLVGEYLVTTCNESRHHLAAANVDVENIIVAKENGNYLYDFGVAADDALSLHLADVGVVTRDGNVVHSINRVYSNVTAIEVVDSSA